MPQNIKNEKSAGAVIYYHNSSLKQPFFLLLKYPSYWGFAKGMIEGKESEIETAKREIKEETGLDKFEILNGFEHKQQWFFKLKGELIKKEAIYFLVKVKEAEKSKVKISFEHEGFEWLSFKDATEKMKIKSNKEMLGKAYKFIKEKEKQKTLV